MNMKRSARFLTCGVLLYGATMMTTATAASAKDGEAVYATKCRNCHGADGAGNPAIAKMMNVTMKPLAAAADADVKTAVTAGVGKMKPVSGVAAGDIDNVTAYIHTLKK
jgi:mono/diheme cytochrome c family protein